jgi:solute carrier family 35 (adenosine 3'-phospho 5'-phosphosulfate transporter), member B2
MLDSSLYGLVLMLGYLGFDGFTSTWQDKMFKGFAMSIYNQILYVQMCSACVSFTMLVVSGQVSRSARGIDTPRAAAFRVRC